MATTTHRSHRLVAAGSVASVARWSATHGTPARDRAHVTVIAPMPTTYEVKPSFNGHTRRPTEGSS